MNRLFRGGFVIALLAGLWFSPTPAGLTLPAWHLFAVFAATICGFVLQVFLNAIDSRTASKFIINLASSAVVAVCAVLLFTVGLGDSLDKIIIGSIIRLVPGVALTTSIRDFLNGDYLSGTIRIIDAFLVGGCIAIGVGAVVMTYISLTGGAPLL